MRECNIWQYIIVGYGTFSYLIDKTMIECSSACKIDYKWQKAH